MEEWMDSSMTSRLIRSMLVICFACGWPIFGAAEMQIAIQKVQIADGIYQFMSAPDGFVPDDNSIVIVNENDVLVFDTFTRPSSARTLLAEIRKITDKPVRYVVNSHHHPDHWSGNEVFAEAFPNIEIISTEESRRYMVNIAKSWPPVWTNNLKKSQDAFDKEVNSGKDAEGKPLTAEQRHEDENDLLLLKDWVGELKNTKRTYPTLTYTDQLILRHGGRELRFMSVMGDATGTTVLYLPKEKVLVTGDTISFPIPKSNSNLPLSQLEKSLRKLSQLDVDVIIPGHGAAMRDKNLLTLEADLIASVTSQVNAAEEQGAVTVEDMQKVVNVDSFRLKFTHGDKDLNEQFQTSVNSMVDNASREARDGRKWQF